MLVVCIMLLFSFFAIDFCKGCFCFMLCLVLLAHSLFYSIMIFIMRSAFNLLVFPNSKFTQFFIWRDYVLSGEIALKNNHYYYYHSRFRDEGTSPAQQKRKWYHRRRFINSDDDMSDTVASQSIVKAIFGVYMCVCVH